MSVFTDSHWPSSFGSNPFGWDSLHSSSPFRGFKSGLGLFDNEDDDDFKPSRMRFRSSGPTLAERGFHDRFDSIFRDEPSVSSNETYWKPAKRYELDEGSSRRTSKGKEIVIPIKVERASPSPSSSTKSDTYSHTLSSLNNTKSSSSSSRSSSSPLTGRVIEIPIIRETSSSESSRPCGKVDTFSRSRDRNSRDQDDMVFMDLDDEDFSLSKSSRLSDDVEVIEVEEEEETVTHRRGKSPRRHDFNSRHDDAATTSNRLAASTPKSTASSSSIRSIDNVTIIDVKGPERSREAVATNRASTAGKRSPQRSAACSGGSSGSIAVTPTPSYPVYEHLKARLASIDRQLDYIRGDGNCFFRALSKDMYGTEDFHMEWRQVVCDVIESHPHVFKQYIDGENVQSHVREMRKPGTWATTCEIYATATLLQREIYVLAPSPANSHEYNWLLFSPRPLSGASASSSTASSSLSRTSTSSHPGHGQVTEVHPCYLTLCYTNGNHYDRIIPVFANCNCEMDPPELNGISLLVDLTEEDGRKLAIR